MSALTLDTVRTVALVAAGAFLVIGIVAAILLKTIAQKVAVAAIAALLALLVWTQRASLQDCADLVRSSVGSGEQATCTFFGREVDIPTRPDS